MEQPFTVQHQDEGTKFEQWRFQETVEIEHKKQKLAAAQHELDREKMSLEREKREFARKQKSDAEQKKQEEHLFDMKWKILEGELQKLAAEKQQVARQKEFYSRVSEYEHRDAHKSTTTSNVVKGDMFFTGVGNESALKKRYKDLIKIYHPDNLAGDTGTIQEINRKYDRLKRELSI